ncbi:MAG: mechanosensitive ion channel family protein [Acidobacteriota bacterium]
MAQRGFYLSRGMTLVIAVCSLQPLLVWSVFAQLPPSPPAASGPEPVVVIGDQRLFPIRTRLGPFSAEERAAAANEKLRRVVRDLRVDVSRILADTHETNTDIVAGDVIITTITDQDAAAAGVARGALANRYVGQLRAALVAVRSEYTYKSLLLGALYATLATLILIALLIVLRRFAPIIYAAIERGRGTHIRTLRIQKLELLSAKRITEMLIQCAQLARFAITVMILYFYIPLVFSFFPWTRTFGTKLLSYVLSPIGAGWNAFLSYIPSLLILAVTAFFAFLAIRFARFIFVEVENGTIGWPGFYPEWAMPTYKMVELLIVAFAIVVMFPYLPGSDSPAFRGISIFFGVLFSLGSTSAVANVIAGVILTYTRAFRVGDLVQIADTTGEVTSKTLLATHVRTNKNVNVTIPNSLVLGSHIVNFSTSAHGQGVILHTGVTIGYDAPWRQVHALLIAAAKATAGMLQEPAPFVLQTSLDDFYVAYEINACTDQPGRMAVIYSELHQNIQDKFNEAGVEILSPHYNAVRDGNVMSIPETYLASGYVAPGFRLYRAGPHGNSRAGKSDESAGRGSS